MSPAPQPRLVAEDLTVGYPGAPAVITGLDLAVPTGAMTAIVGPNACGKSTLLRSMSRLLGPRAGTCCSTAARCTAPGQAARPRARSAAAVAHRPEGITVGDLVSRGRHPHQRALARWSAEDERAVGHALEATGTVELVDRAVDELSGGQRQRCGSPWPSRRRPECCSSTSRRPSSTSAIRSRSSTCSPTSTAAAARRSSWSCTTSTSPPATPTTSSRCARAGCTRAASPARSSPRARRGRLRHRELGHRRPRLGQAPHDPHRPSSRGPGRRGQPAASRSAATAGT